MPVGMKPLVLTSVEVGLSDLTCHQIVRHLHPSYIPTWILWVKQKIVGNKGRPPPPQTFAVFLSIKKGA